MSVLTDFFPAASGGGGGVTSNPNYLQIAQRTQQ